MEVGAIGDDVVLGAGVDRADGHHARRHGMDLTRDQGLQIHNNGRRQHHRVPGRMGVSAVTANAVHGDIHHVRIGHHPARDVTDLTRGQSGQGVQREVVIGRAETFEQTVGEHGSGAGAALLGRLHNHHQATAPLALSLLQRQRRGHDHGHMHVVAAGVHHRHLAAVEFRGPHRAGVRQAGLLGHGQGVHIRAQQ